MALPPDETDLSPANALDAARDGAVVCDLPSLRVLAIAGADAATFLNGQLSTDVKSLVRGTCQHTSFNSPKGRMLAAFVLWPDPAAPDAYFALIPADIAEAVAKRLRMYVLRSKVTLTDVSAETSRMGVGGPRASDAIRATFGAAPAPFEAPTFGARTVLGLPGPRFVVVVPSAAADAMRTDLLRHATEAPPEVWDWLTIRAGVPVISAATQDAFVAQAANWDALGGIDFRKGCYTGQEIIARMHYLGRQKERAFLFHVATPGAAPGDRIYSAAFAGQACGTVVNAAAAPGGGCDILAVLQLAAAERGDARLGAPDGPVLVPLPLPYSIPAAVEPRGRIG